MAIRRGLMSAMSNANNPVYYTKYELTADTTIRALLEDKQYHTHYDNVLILIRANGNVAPQTGSYTMNNYMLCQMGSNVIRCMHRYVSGRVAPDTISTFVTNEGDEYLTVLNGVLIYQNSTSTSCLGTSGDNVVIVEIPFDYNKYIGID